jgi:hypothetical protein
MNRWRDRVANAANVVPRVAFGLTVVSLGFASVLPGGFQEFFSTTAYVCIVISALGLLVTGRMA